MRSLSKLLFLSIIVILSSCGSNNLMKYYYPINDTNEIKIYKYVDPTESESPTYWKTTTDVKNNTILTESYNSNFKLFNSFLEKINKEETNLLKYVDYEDGTNETIIEINATVKKNKVYASDKKVEYSYAVAYGNIYGKMYLEKKRQFIGFEEITVQGKKYSVAKFKDEYLVNAIEQNDKFVFFQISYYAKGIGMIKSVRTFSDMEQNILELEKILTEDEFKKLKR